MADKTASKEDPSDALARTIFVITVLGAAAFIVAVFIFVL